MLRGSSPITLTSPSSKAHQRSGSFPPPALPSFNGRMTLSDSRQSRRLSRRRGRYPRPQRVSPDYPNHLSDVPCLLPRRIKRVRVSIASPLIQPSPNGRRVGIRIVTFEACSGFAHVTARRIAQPPKATFVTRLQPSSYPAKPLVSFQINRQLSGWNLPPLMIRAFGAHGQKPTFASKLIV